MSRKLAMTPTIKTSNLSKPEKVACPKCDASLVFYRSDKPHIDECGFESYCFKCKVCGSMLTGIIDPAEDALLVTVSSWSNLKRARLCAAWIATHFFSNCAGDRKSVV